MCLLAKYFYDSASKQYPSAKIKSVRENRLRIYLFTITIKTLLCQHSTESAISEDRYKSEFHNPLCEVNGTYAGVCCVRKHLGSQPAQRKRF